MELGDVAAERGREVWDRATTLPAVAFAWDDYGRGWASVSTGPVVTKALWTDADFDAMGWHDNAVHAIALEPASDDPGSLLLDIDYIVEWEPSAVPHGLLSFWVCPATLIFHQA